MAEIRTVFEFETLFDIDYSIIELIKDKFYNSKYFSKQILDEDPFTMRYILLAREDENPLTVVLNDDYQNSANVLYREILEEYHDQIYSNIYKTNIFDFVITLLNINEQSIKPGIFIENEYQFQVIEATLKDRKREYIEVNNLKDFDSFDTLYIKRSSILDGITEKLKLKHIFLCNYGFNTVLDISGEFKVKPELYDKYGENNIFYITKLYKEIDDIGGNLL